MTYNVSEFYIQADGTLFQQPQIEPLFRGSNYTTLIRLITPLTNTMFVSFHLAKGSAPTRRMRKNGTQAVIVNQQIEIWNVYEYLVGSDVLQAVSQLKATPVFISFTEVDVFEDPVYKFKGFYSSLLELQTFIPSPDENDYAAVGALTKDAEAFVVVGGVWETSNLTVKEFEVLNSVSTVYFIKKTEQIPLPVNPSIPLVMAALDLDATTDIYQQIADLEQQILDIPIVPPVVEPETIYFPQPTKAAEQINKGDVVMFAGALGGQALVEKANTIFVNQNPKVIIGVAAESAAMGDPVKIMWFGKLTGIATGTWQEGDILYFNHAVDGGLTNQKPSIPNQIVFVAAVKRASSSPQSTNGELLIRPTFSGSIRDLSDVNGNPSVGDILIWNGSWWEASDLLETLIQAVSSLDVRVTNLENE